MIDAAADEPVRDVAVERDAREPTIRADADGPTANNLVEIKTTPTGATLRIGDQTRQAPAELALPAGKHTIIAELAGWQPERREIELLQGDHLVHEIVFTKRIGTPSRPPPQAPTIGKLAVRTNPYSDVFHGTRKLGQTPFEIDMPVGTYMLRFKNPNHPTVSRSVKVTGTRAAKVVFDLPL